MFGELLTFLAHFLGMAMFPAKRIRNYSFFSVWQIIIGFSWVSLLRGLFWKIILPVRFRPPPPPPPPSPLPAPSLLARVIFPNFQNCARCEKYLKDN